MNRSETPLLLILGSLFLAMAVMFGEMEINLFMILPIKMKYIAWLDAVLLIYTFLVGTWATRLALVLSLLPFFLFFGKDAYLSVRRDIWKLKNWWMRRSR